MLMLKISAVAEQTSHPISPRPIPPTSHRNSAEPRKQARSKQAEKGSVACGILLLLHSSTEVHKYAVRAVFPSPTDAEL